MKREVESEGVKRRLKETVERDKGERDEGERGREK